MPRKSIFGRHFSRDHTDVLRVPIRKWCSGEFAERERERERERVSAQDSFLRWTRLRVKRNSTVKRNFVHLIAAVLPDIPGPNQWNETFI